ncbi:MAG: SoxR reducing system RseC family protein [Planctomycetota bacterium]|nr:SoxR reducing system RseC family protein [Planctomycetota bacterium]
MQIRGKIVSISGDEIEVCIIRENTTCGSCSTCPKKMGIRDIVKVAAIKEVQIGQEVVLCDNKNWFIKNKVVFAVIAFVLGIIMAEGISTVVSFGQYREEADLLGGMILTIILLIVSRIRKPRYLLRIERVEGGKT